MEKGNKQPVMLMPFKEQYKDKGKHEHTVSLYLLGLLLKDKVDLFLRNKLKELMDCDNWYDFKYTWFLGCLLHDVASCIENNHEKYSINSNYTVFTHKPKREKVVLTRFSEETINKYLRYRKDCDHGIVGGNLIFWRLCQTFKNRTKGHDWEERPCLILNKKGIDLWYCEDHLDHFAYIADAIISHNIWMAYDDPTKERYQKNELEELIIDCAENRLKLEDYPLQFILCLLDTIEPVKRFQSLDAKTVLENMFIDISDTTIKIGCNSVIKKQSEFYKWFGNIAELEKWMNVEVSDCMCDGEICYIEIKWNI